MTPMLSADFAHVTAAKRLEGLLDGRFTPDWPGEPYALLGAVWGAFGV